MFTNEKITNTIYDLDELNELNKLDELNNLNELDELKEVIELNKINKDAHLTLYLQQENADLKNQLSVWIKHAASMHNNLNNVVFQYEKEKREINYNMQQKIRSLNKIIKDQQSQNNEPSKKKQKNNQ
jgi:hypothetical protein